ncbi:addiction module toxin RelE [Brevibacillus reuszeri]|uniref:type II toxin-antitoxin system RelE/ParE family toxin n=1 Tax=Brevibacillus reuszeri TaxID=54915 RepID=UPI001B0A8045|nr:type II toxin-antitoxin system RelE/ParE family toxin [Brevibacillus reuszeri]GIO04363.1 addiction module toxin RelE [Brevibacillus reuszeri]
MKKYSIVITEPAEADLLGIADYIAHELKEPTVAKNLMAKLAEAIGELEQLPFRYEIVSDERLANQKIRKLVVEKYIVFYMVSQNNMLVTIVRILYGKREWNHLL